MFKKLKTKSTHASISKKKSDHVWQRKKRDKDPKVSKKKSKKKNTVNRVVEKEHVFPDVRMYHIMPNLLAIAVFLFFIGFGWIFWNSHEYKVAQSRLSMVKGTQLPLFSGSAKGQLTVGDSILSKDKKHLAVSIRYDPTAHNELSAFGKKYGLWIVAPNNYPIKELHVKYGFFGTDGNGVIQVSSDRPFKNEAFAVLLVDKGHLLTSEQLNAGVQPLSDNQINNSITAKLANGELNQQNDNQTDDSSQKGTPPIYSVRLNPYSAVHSNIDWGNNEVKLVDHLFVERNLRKIQGQINKINTLLREARETQNEYKARLRENPNDQTALSNEQSVQSTITSLTTQLRKDRRQLRTLKRYKISKHILGPEQTKFRTLKAPQAQFQQRFGANNDKKGNKTGGE